MILKSLSSHFTVLWFYLSERTVRTGLSKAFHSSKFIKYSKKKVNEEVWTYSWKHFQPPLWLVTNFLAHQEYRKLIFLLTLSVPTKTIINSSRLLVTRMVQLLSHKEAIFHEMGCKVWLSLFLRLTFKILPYWFEKIFSSSDRSKVDFKCFFLTRLYHLQMCLCMAVKQLIWVKRPIYIEKAI